MGYFLSNNAMLCLPVHAHTVQGEFKHRASTDLEAQSGSGLEGDGGHVGSGKAKGRVWGPFHCQIYQPNQLRHPCHKSIHIYEAK